MAKTGASNKATMASIGRVVSAVVGDGEDPLGTNPVGLGDGLVDYSGTLHGGGVPSHGAHPDLGSGPPTMSHLDLSPTPNFVYTIRAFFGPDPGVFLFYQACLNTNVISGTYN